MTSANIINQNHKRGTGLKAKQVMSRGFFNSPRWLAKPVFKLRHLSNYIHTEPWHVVPFPFVNYGLATPHP